MVSTVKASVLPVADPRPRNPAVEIIKTTSAWFSTQINNNAAIIVYQQRI